jgi:hypothetical protein
MRLETPHLRDNRELEPLGGVDRIRRTVYPTVSSLRHLNGTPAVDAPAMSIFGE